jgi:hypothetical protein
LGLLFSEADMIYTWNTIRCTMTVAALAERSGHTSVPDGTIMKPRSVTESYWGEVVVPACKYIHTCSYARGFQQLTLVSPYVILAMNISCMGAT